MLDKLVIHLKNVIFFKAVIYLLLVVLFLVVMPILKDDLARSTQRQEKSKTFLQAAKVKLNSIIDFEDKILSTDEQQKLITHSTSSSCIRRIKLLNDIKALSRKYKLLDPITIKVNRNFEAGQIPNTHGHLKVKYYDLYINFKAQNYHSILSIIHEINLLLPKGSIVKDTKIFTTDALTPKIIKKLNTSNSPNLIKTYIQIQLRDIVYDK